MKKSIVLLVIAVFSLIKFNAYAQGTCCLTSSINVSTGYNPVTAAVIPGAPNGSVTSDPKWTVAAYTPDVITYVGLTGWSLVPIGGMADIIDAGGAAMSGNSPISCLDADNYNSGGVAGHTFSMDLQRDFYLVCTSAVTIDICIECDDGCDVFLDGSLTPMSLATGTGTSYSNWNAPNCFIYTSPALAGGTMHSIMVRVYNYDNISPATYYENNYTFLRVSGTVTSSVPDALRREDVTSCSSTTTYCMIPAITGPAQVCVGQQITLTDAETGGTWSSSDVSLATVVTSTGVVTGVSAGTPTITYTDPCGRPAEYPVTVIALPTIDPVPAIVCVGSTLDLNGTPSGGTWSSSAPGTASVGPSSGVLGGVTAGTSSITYTTTAGCTTAITATVNPKPVISGTLTICQGLTTTLTANIAGGTWSSGNTSVGTVTSAGVVTGVSGGSVNISYLSPAGCVAFAAVAVNPAPELYTLPLTVCPGADLLIGTTVLGGTWTSSSTAVATVSSGGMAGGIIAGTTTITYTSPAGCIKHETLTVNPLPVITGTLSVCAPSSTILSTTFPGGGTWSNSSSTIATVTSSGIVTGVSYGTSIITFTPLLGVCIATAIVTVNETPGPLTGTPLTVCVASSQTLSDIVPSGTWSSSNTGVATVNAAGSVTGAAPGTSIITYTTPCGHVTTVVTVDMLSVTAATSLPSLCAGDPTAVTLSSVTTGGIGSVSHFWTPISVAGGSFSFNPGISPGVTTLYTTFVSDGVCFAQATVTVTVNPIPTFTGPSELCIGPSLEITPDVPGGTWSSSNSAVASVILPAFGLLNGVAVGTAIISYTTPSGCTGTYPVTVNPVPAAISGVTTVCAGGTTILADAVAGGTWSSSPLTIATVDAAGIVYGVLPGTATVTYTNTCGSVPVIVTVNPVPGLIGGSLVICGIGNTTTLTDPVLGGAWSSSATAVATVNAVTGVVSSAGPGVTTITYTLPGGCSITATVTVNTSPAPVHGPATVCAGGTINLTDGTAGGVWSSSASTVASVDPVTGVVTGESGGTATIFYTTAFCSPAIFVVTVNPAVAITGPTTVCTGSTITLSDAVLGGAWSSSATAVATVDAITGVVSGVSPGVTTITYTTPMGCTGTYEITVNTLPGPINGLTTVCAGGTITLTDGTAGGAWTSSDGTIATVDATGIVYGVSTGTVTISYTTACGPAIAIVTVMPGSCVCGIVFTPFSGSLTTSPPPGNYYITGSVTIDGNVSLSGCVLQMAPGVTVTVNSGWKLTISGSHLFCCAPNMWQGIILATGGAGTGQLEVDQNAMIEDAQVAVDIDGPFAPGYLPGAPTSSLILYTHGATFNKNAIDIRIMNYAPFLPPGGITDFDPQYPFVIENTVFTCRKFDGFTSSSGAWPMAWPATTGPASTGALKAAILPATPYDPPYYLDIAYARTICNSGAQSLYGIDLENVGITTGSLALAQYSGVVTGGPLPADADDMNLYDNMGYGIYAHNSNLVSRNSGFIHMHLGKTTGDGIYSFSDATATSLYKLDVYGSDLSYNNQFWDCSNAVEAFGLYDVIGTYAVMSSKHSTSNMSDPQGQYGYKVSSSNFYNMQIGNNSIYNIGNGISVIINPPGVSINQVTIDNNNISAVNPGGIPSLGEYISQGIFMQNLLSGTSSALIILTSEINIDNNVLTNVYNGIFMNGTNSSDQETTTSGNTISVIQDPTKPILQTGIEHINTINDYIYNNTVSGPGYNNPLPPSSHGGTYLSSQTLEGIHVESTQKQWVECNTVTDINTGFYFAGTNITFYWLNNIMQNNAYGFVFGPGLINSGAPPTYGNQWLPTGFWTGTNWQTYTAGGSPAFFPLEVFGPGGTQDPTNNSGESGIYSPSNHLDVSSDPNSLCVAPSPTTVPMEMRETQPAVVPVATKDSKLSVFPNPNNGSLTVIGALPNMSNTGQASIEITDMLGRTVYQGSAVIENGAINKSIALGDNIANGTYLIKVIDNSTSQVIHFVVNR